MKEKSHIIVYRSRVRLFAWMLISVLFVWGGLGLVQNPVSYIPKHSSFPMSLINNSQDLHILDYAAIVLFALPGLLSLIYLLSNLVFVVFTNEGFRVNAILVKNGLIRWQDVTSLKFMCNPASLAWRRPFILLVHYKHNMKASVISTPLFAIKGGPKKFLKLLQEQYKAPYSASLIEMCNTSPSYNQPKLFTLKRE